MCTKISTFLLIMAPMMIQKGILSLTIVNRDDVVSDEEMKNIIVKNIRGQIGRSEFLTCPDLNGTAKYTWLKNNELLEDSKTIKLFNNGTELLVRVTPESIGNYTCKCEVAGCKSHTFQLNAAFDERNELAEDMEKICDVLYTPLDILRGFLNIFGREYGKSCHFPRQNLSADFQKVFVKKVDETLKTVVYLTCQDAMNVKGDNYIWLKNNVTYERDAEQASPGGLLFLKLSSEEQSGNYTCLCKDTSCVPHNHTYQVIIGSSEEEEPNHQSNLISNQTQGPILWPNMIDTIWSSFWHNLRSFASMVKISVGNRGVIKLSTAIGLEKRSS